jgi:hypothetical protein
VTSSVPGVFLGAADATLCSLHNRRRLLMGRLPAWIVGVAAKGGNNPSLFVGNWA